MEGSAAAGQSRGARTGVPRATALAGRLASSCFSVLGEVVVSVILHGSLVLGDYVPGQSDVDLLVIVNGSLGQAEIDALVRVAAAEQTHTADRVDLRVVTREVAATPSELPPMELQLSLNPGCGAEVVSHHPGEPDLVVEFSLCRQCGEALRGTPPRELIGEVPDQWVLRVGDAALERWQALTEDARNAALMVLTACRIWRFGELRSHCSKSEAGSWALTRDPSLRAVRLALNQRSGAAEPIDPGEIGRVLATARAAVADRRV